MVPQSIQIDLNDEGQRSGTGTVAFETREAADQAVKGKNLCYIGSRYVELSMLHPDTEVGEQCVICVSE